LGEKEPSLDAFFKKVGKEAEEEKKGGAAEAPKKNYMAEGQEVILFFGAPGSGKSTFYNQNFSKGT
jgi:energy-coupling factor transporter ATP-binding protein EcfA2